MSDEGKEGPCFIPISGKIEKWENRAKEESKSENVGWTLIEE